MTKNSKLATGSKKKNPAPGRPLRQSPRSPKNSVTAVRANSDTVARGKVHLRGTYQPPEKITTKFIFYANSTLELACMPADAPVRFSLDMASYLTGVHPAMIGYYCRLGLIESSSGVWDQEIFFDENTLQEIRRIEHYRRHLGVSRRALPLICELRRESERSQIEIHFLRYPEVAQISE